MTYSVPRHLGGLGRGARESASVLIIYAAAAAGRSVPATVRVQLFSAANDRRLLYCADRRIDGCGRWRAGPPSVAQPEISGGNLYSPRMVAHNNIK